MKVTFEFTIEEIHVILQGLVELPAKTSMVLIEKIHSEANGQVNKPKESPILSKD
jgi:hypothetical protein